VARKGGRCTTTVGVGEALMPCLLGEGRPNTPSLFEAMLNSSVESPVG
jgi:hypothetical protein